MLCNSYVILTQHVPQNDSDAAPLLPQLNKTYLVHIYRYLANSQMLLPC